MQPPTYADKPLAGALFLFSSWYTKKELAVRISVLYAAGQMAGAFGGLLGSAIMAGMDGKAGLANWRWLCMKNPNISRYGTAPGLTEIQSSSKAVPHILQLSLHTLSSPTILVRPSG